MTRYITGGGRRSGSGECFRESPLTLLLFPSYRWSCSTCTSREPRPPPATAAAPPTSPPTNTFHSTGPIRPPASSSPFHFIPSAADGLEDLQILLHHLLESLKVILAAKTFQNQDLHLNRHLLLPTARVTSLKTCIFRQRSRADRRKRLSSSVILTYL